MMAGMANMLYGTFLLYNTTPGTPCWPFLLSGPAQSKLQSKYSLPREGVGVGGHRVALCASDRRAVWAHRTSSNEPGCAAG
jgi:hypothetical protein